MVNSLVEEPLCCRQHEDASSSYQLRGVTREINERLRQLHDLLRAAHTEEQNRLADGIQDWLMLNSGAFREELVATAQGKRNGSEAAQEEALDRLLKVDLDASGGATEQSG